MKEVYLSVRRLFMLIAYAILETKAYTTPLPRV